MRSILFTAVLLGAAWKPGGSDGALVIEVRDDEAQALSGVRITGSVRASWEDVCEATWHIGGADAGAPGIKTREVLVETEDSRVRHEQVAAPIVKDRDYTLQSFRTRDAGFCNVSFASRNDLGPKPSPQLVRIERIEGFWRTTASADGGATLTYETNASIDTPVPTFLLSGPRKSRAVELWRWVERRALTAPSSPPGTTR